MFCLDVKPEEEHWYAFDHVLTDWVPVSKDGAVMDLDWIATRKLAYQLVSAIRSENPTEEELKVKLIMWNTGKTTVVPIIKLFMIKGRHDLFLRRLVVQQLNDAGLTSDRSGCLEDALGYVHHHMSTFRNHSNRWQRHPYSPFRESLHLLRLKAATMAVLGRLELNSPQKAVIITPESWPAEKQTETMEVIIDLRTLGGETIQLKSGSKFRAWGGC